MESFIKTRGAELKKNASENFVVVTYRAPKKKVKSSEIVNQHENNDSKLTSSTNSSLERKEDRVMDFKRQQEVEMKRARYDVIKFGMSGFDKPKAEEARVALAVELGAKPRRNKAKNYKVLKAERQKVKEEAKKEEKLSTLNKTLTKRKVKRKFNKKQSGILNLYGKVQKNV